ncbi:aminopeptidase P family protein [Magnetovibrio sp. PR-2]|uniref:aminopeptidase P family protein n=1 Tax=Magnetovibrio sp. PR-2 TaxID=3120356 RepID=UPI002FCDEBD7
MTHTDPIAYDPTLLAKLRGRMKADGIAAYLVPHADAFQSEYLPPSDERLARLTGFSGSAGSAVVMVEDAAVFVDGRYTLQVQNEVDAKHFTPTPIAETRPTAWLRQRLKAGDRLAYDPWLYTPAQLSGYETLCQDLGAEMVALSQNLIDVFWPERPAPPASAVTALKPPFAPLTSDAKRELVGKSLDKAGAEAAVISAGDSIAWLFNFRADDVPFTPLVLAYALLHKDGSAQLFIDTTRLDEEVRDHLGPDVALKSPDQLGAALDQLAQDKQAVRVCSQTAPAWIMERLSHGDAKVVSGSDPCQLPKAKKTPAELDGMRAAHVRDGAALTTFLAWLSNTGPKGGVTEMSAAEKLDGLRAQNDHFQGLSFPTISGSGPNGAIVHYRVTEDSDRELKTGELYLVDSGAQYLDGTTDVTRTVAIGEPTAEMRDRFTRVLKGHIAISTQVFPRGTKGYELDILARRALWEVGLDYDHGTGHGVGTYLGVHEGPQSISKRGVGAALATGMVLSNEPGYYKTGAFGIRIENLICVKQLPAPKGAEREMMGFEPLTLAPIDRTLLEDDLLSPAERAWVNAYHTQVFEKIAPLLDDETRKWLEWACQPL